MARPDRSRISDMSFSTKTLDDRTPKAVLKKGEKLSPSMRKFLYKLNEELFSEFTKQEWVIYWQKRFKETNGTGYFINKADYVKHYAVMTKLMNSFTPVEVKTMIDFLFDSSQDYEDKRLLTVYMLSGGWTTKIYQASQLWAQGQFMTKREKWNKENEEARKARELPKRNREWTNPPEETTPKSRRIVIK